MSPLDIRHHDGPAHPTWQVLGCEHNANTVRLKDSGKVVQAMEYDMESFFESCIELYHELTDSRYSKLKTVPTPFIADPAKQEMDGHGVAVHQLPHFP